MALETASSEGFPFHSPLEDEPMQNQSRDDLLRRWSMGPSFERRKADEDNCL